MIILPVKKILNYTFVQIEPGNLSAGTTNTSDVTLQVHDESQKMIMRCILHSS